MPTYGITQKRFRVADVAEHREAIGTQHSKSPPRANQLWFF